MASKTICKPLSEQQHKMPGGQVFESASQPPSPLQVPKPSKPENTPSRFPKFVQEDTSTHGTTEVFKGEKSNNHQEAATGPLADRIPPNISEHSGTSDLDASSSDMKQLSVQGKPMELLQLNGTISLEGNSDMKENSEQGSVKDNSVSAKISDDPSGLTKTSGSVKVSDQVESGKSSMYRASTSSDISDESTCCSISSTINKPHKANDSRWEAIQVIRARAGVLGLNHFRLLKRLGCGDIGTVYLSELSGTKCYFAMKVMDKVSLSSRKKLLRAQTERDILQCLDHPFLPTLYTHFETEKFSCLVMEFCPGGDLHTLRQRQPGKYFSEKAVK